MEKLGISMDKTMNDKWDVQKNKQTKKQQKKTDIPRNRQTYV